MACQLALKAVGNNATDLGYSDMQYRLAGSNHAPSILVPLAGRLDRPRQVNQFNQAYLCEASCRAAPAIRICRAQLHDWQRPSTTRRVQQEFTLDYPNLCVRLNSAVHFHLRCRGLRWIFRTLIPLRYVPFKRPGSSTKRTNRDFLQVCSKGPETHSEVGFFSTLRLFIRSETRAIRKTW